MYEKGSQNGGCKFHINNKSPQVVEDHPHKAELLQFYLYVECSRIQDVVHAKPHCVQMLTVFQQDN